MRLPATSSVVFLYSWAAIRPATGKQAVLSSILLNASLAQIKTAASLRLCAACLALDDACIAQEPAKDLIRPPAAHRLRARRSGRAHDLAI